MPLTFQHFLPSSYEYIIFQKRRMKLGIGIREQYDLLN